MIGSNHAYRGIFWSAISRVTSQLLQFTTLIILARLLDPKEFGLITSSVVVIGFLNIFRDLGISSAIIQKASISEELINTLFWVVLLIGISLNLLLFLVAPQIADFYNAPKITDLLRVLSFSFTISSSTILHQSLLERELKFKQLANYEIISIAIGSISGISAAYMGYGVWSLIIQMFMNVTTLSFLLWLRSDFKPKIFYSGKELKSVYNFSLNLSGFNIVNYFVRNADYVLIQKYLGEVQLGFYNIAYRIMLYPLQNITAVFSRVMFPYYSKLQNDFVNFRKMYIDFVNNIAFISFPLMLWIIAVGDILIVALFGEKWSPIIPLVMVLAPIGMVQSIYTPAGTIFQATGRTDIWFKWGIFTGIIFISSFVIGLKWGVLGVAIGYLIANLITLYPGMMLSFRLINLSISEFILSFKKTFLISITMFILVYVVKIFLAKYIAQVELLIILIVLSIGFYITLSFRYNRKRIDDLFSIIKGHQ